MISHVPFEWPFRKWWERFFHERAEEAREQKKEWIPETDTERRVYAALILAGRPVTNGELAALMNCSKSQASKDVAAVKDQVQKLRFGREVRISLQLPN